MTSLIISPLRLRKLKISVYATVVSMFVSVFITTTFNISPIIFEFEIRNFETWNYLRNFPIPIIGGMLALGYDFLFSNWVINALIWGAIIGFIASTILIQRLVIDKATHLLRGNAIVAASVLRGLIKGKSRLKLGKEKIPIPYTNENRSFGVIGMAGAGKTQGVFSILEQVKNFKETMIIYDRKPDFWVSYYRPEQDFLFYPADERSIKWNFFDDIPEGKQAMLDEVDKIVKSFIPTTESKEQFWDNTARMIFKAIVIKIKVGHEPSTKKMIDFLIDNQTKDEIWEHLKEINDIYGLSIKTLLNAASEATAGSMMMNLQPYFAKVIRPEFYFEEGNFSITEFINSTKDINVDQRLFLVQTKNEEGNYEGYFRVMLDMMTRSILTLNNNSARRIWTFLDEFQTLGKLNEINDLLAEGRSKGSCVALSTQDLSRLEEIYTENLMRNIFQLLSTKLILQYDDPKGQKFISEFLGEQEVEEKNKNRMISRDASKDIEQVSERNTTKKVLLTGELGLLKQLSAYLKMPSYPATIINFKYFEPELLFSLIPAPETEMFHKRSAVIEAKKGEATMEENEKAEKASKAKKPKTNEEYEEINLDEQFGEKDEEIENEIQKNNLLLVANKETNGLGI